MKMKFGEWDCKVRFGNYANNGRICISLVDAEDGCPIATATVNISQIPINKNEVIIKDYSENGGMFDALVKAGIVENKVGECVSGFVTAPIGMLTPEAYREATA